jgi:hypothetical protein
MIHSQHIENDVRRAALLLFMGYKLNRVVTDAQGTQYLFDDPSDILEACAAYDAGEQVASAKGLLERYDDLLGKPKPEPEGSPAADDSGSFISEYGTYDTNFAAVLHYLQFPFLGATCESSGKCCFVFKDNGTAKSILAKYKKDDLLVDAYGLQQSGYFVRNALRDVKQGRTYVPISSGLSNGDSE